MRRFRSFGLFLLPVLCALARANDSRGVRIRDVLPTPADVPVYQALIVGINEYREMPPLAYAETADTAHTWPIIATNCAS